MPYTTIEIPLIKSCNATECSYNIKNACHARAITVGDSLGPNCDTFINRPRCSPNSGQSGVGACKMNTCAFNRQCECQADSIEVGKNDNGVQCLTFMTDQFSL